MTEQTLLNKETFTIVAPDQHDLMNKSQNLIQQTDKIEINNDVDLEKSGDLVKFLRIIFKKAEKQRTDLTSPILTTKKKIDADYKKITDPIKNAIAVAQNIMTKYVNERERLLQIERDEQIKIHEEVALTLAEQTQITEGKYAAESVIEQATIDIALVENSTIKTKVYSDYGSTTSSIKIRKWRINDIKKIQDKFLMLDESAIRQCIKSYKEVVDSDADSKGLKGKERESFTKEKMSDLKISGIEFYFETKACVR